MVFSFANAQKIDVKSKAILDAVSANYKAKKNIYFKFTFTTGNGKTTKTEPGIFYSTSSQYRMKIMGTEQIFDGKKMYSISDDDKEVTVAIANSENAAFSPINYLDSYKKSYDATYIGKKNINGVNADYIKLAPVKNNGLKNVNIYVDATKKQLLQIEQYSTDNSVSVISIKDFKENQNLDASMFNFDKNKYKNYLVTEL